MRGESANGLVLHQGHLEGKDQERALLEAYDDPFGWTQPSGASGAQDGSTAAPRSQCVQIAARANRATIVLSASRPVHCLEKPVQSQRSWSIRTL
jgi:hypothetical protein